MSVRTLVLVLGDQLDPQSSVFDRFDDGADAILMVEVREEASYIRQHKTRLTFFFAAMRHFRDEQRECGRRVFYSALDDSENRGSFAGEIARRISELKPLHVKVLVWRWRHHWHQALCRLGQLHQPDERPLPALPLRARASNRRKCVSFYHPLLGFSGAA